MESDCSNRRSNKEGKLSLSICNTVESLIDVLFCFVTTFLVSFLKKNQ